MIRWTLAMWSATIVALAVGSVVAAEGADAPYPKLVTAETRADAKKLSALQRPGDVIFRDGFESPESLKKYFENHGYETFATGKIFHNNHHKKDN